MRVLLLAAGDRRGGRTGHDGHERWRRGACTAGDEQAGDDRSQEANLLRQDCAVGAARKASRECDRGGLVLGRGGGEELDAEGLDVQERVRGRGRIAQEAGAQQGDNGPDSGA